LCYRSPRSRRAPPRTLAIYYTWYGNPHFSGQYLRWASSTHDPSRPGSRGYPDSATAHHPSLGMYDSHNPLIVREHVREAMSAGIDGFVATWWSSQPASADALQVLFRVAEAEGFAVSVLYEQAPAREPQAVRADIERLLSEYGVSPALLRDEGTPVLFISRAATRDLGVESWRSLAEDLSRGAGAVRLVGEDADSAVLQELGLAEPAWPGPEALPRAMWESLLPWYLAAERAGDDSLRSRRYALVTPGHDDSGAAGGEPLIVPRGAGELYEQSWVDAFGGSPDRVLIDSWNGWHDGTEIEPSLEDGDRYVRLTREFAQAFRDGTYLSAEPSRVLLSVGDEVEVRVTARNWSRDGRKGWVALEPVGDDRFAPQVTPATVAVTLPPHSERTGLFKLKVTQARELGPAQLRARAEFGRQRPVEARVAVDLAHPFSVRIAPVTAPWFGEDAGPSVLLTNLRGEAADCTVTLCAHGDPPLTRETRLGPRGSEVIPFPQPGGIGAYMPDDVWVGVAGAGHEMWQRLPVDWAAAPRMVRPIVVDGDLSDWGNRAPFHLTQPEQVADMTHWAPDDLCAVACTAWDNDSFYVGVEVTDDMHVQTETGARMWTGDSVQFAIDARGDRSRAYDDDDYEYGLALSPEGPVVWRWQAAGYRRVGEVSSAKLAVRRSGTKTVYELALPWDQLNPLEPTADASFGFTLVVNDADETKLGENVRKGSIQYTPGIIHAKDPSQFARWRLVESLGWEGG
jgi:glycoprotein endo-alpha-1,2-mannosidase